MEPNKQIHKYFRVDDIVANADIWGDALFVVHGFGGNAYLPELYVHRYGKPKTIANSCNWDVRDTELVNAPKRPFKKLKTNMLLKLIKKHNEEAKREFIIRTNIKRYV
jgi:hypothetical protein